MKNKKNINNEFIDLFNLINKSKKRFLIISVILLSLNSVFISNIKPMQIGSASFLPAAVAKIKLYESTEHAFKELDLSKLKLKDISPKCKVNSYTLSSDENFIAVSYKSREKEEIYECLTNIERYIQSKEYEKFNSMIQIIDEKINFYKGIISQSPQNRSKLGLSEIEMKIMELNISKISKIETHPTQKIGSIEMTNNQHYPRLVIIIIVLLLSLIISMIVELFKSYKHSQSNLE